LVAKSRFLNFLQLQLGLHQPHLSTISYNIKNDEFETVFVSFNRQILAAIVIGAASTALICNFLPQHQGTQLNCDYGPNCNNNLKPYLNGKYLKQLEFVKSIWQKNPAILVLCRCINKLLCKLRDLVCNSLLIQFYLFRNFLHFCSCGFHFRALAWFMETWALHPCMFSTIHFQMEWKIRRM